MAKLQGDAALAERALNLGVMLARGERITSATIRKKFGVSKATAKRDMNLIEAALPVRCEVMPGRRAIALELPHDQ